MHGGLSERFHPDRSVYSYEVMALDIIITALQ